MKQIHFSRMKKILSIILYSLGRIFKKQPKLLSIYFHDLSNETFEREIKWLIRQGYVFIDTQKLVRLLKKEIPLDRKYCYISFDDGRKENLNLVPILEKYNVPITIFCAVQPIVEGGAFWWDYVLAETHSKKLVNEIKAYPEQKFIEVTDGYKKRNPLERAAITIEEMRQMDAHSLIDIQSHTMTHPILTTISENRLNDELCESQAFLSKVLGKSVYAFSYPNGSLTGREVKVAKQYYDCAFTTEERYPVPGCDLYLIPRIVQTDDYWTNLARIERTWKIVERLKKS